jgi:hypothetical protein
MTTIHIPGRKTITRTVPMAAFAALALALAVAGQTPAWAIPDYGPDTCIQGFVFREARPGDDVCVTPNVRDLTAQQNAQAASHVDPKGGAYGPGTCLQGYVFREAYPGDQVCVTPDVRDEAHADNANANARKASNYPGQPGQSGPQGLPGQSGSQGQGTVQFDVVGSGPGGAATGEVYGIVTDAGTEQSFPDKTPLPFHSSRPYAPGVKLFQVHATTEGASCTITVDGVVVVTGQADCVYNRP